MAIGPEDIHYKIEGRLVCAYDIEGCDSWEKLAGFVGVETIVKAAVAGYAPLEFALWLLDNDYEQHVSATCCE